MVLLPQFLLQRNSRWSEFSRLPINSLPFSELDPHGWDTRVTGFRFNAVQFLDEAGVLPSIQNTEKIASPGQNEGPGDDGTTGSTALARLFDTPVQTAISQKLGAFLIKENPDWHLVAQSEGEYLNQQFFVQPRLNRGQGVELGQR